MPPDNERPDGGARAQGSPELATERGFMSTVAEEPRAGHDQHGHHDGGHCRTVDIHVNNKKVVLQPGRYDVPTFKKVAERCENLAGWKIAVRGLATGENSLAHFVESLNEASVKTGRKVAPLIAGDANLFGALEAGAVGTINACESVRIDDNTALYAAYMKGDKATANAIFEKGKPISDIIYGVRGNRVERAFAVAARGKVQ